jgi:hypothetical protein
MSDTAARARRFFVRILTVVYHLFFGRRGGWKPRLKPCSVSGAIERQIAIDLRRRACHNKECQLW